MNRDSDQFSTASRAVGMARGSGSGNPFTALINTFGTGRRVENNLRLHIKKQILTGAIGAASEHEKFAARITGTHEGLVNAGWDKENPIKSVGPQGLVFQATGNRRRAQEERDENRPDPGADGFDDASFDVGAQPTAKFHGGATEEPVIKDITNTPPAPPAAPKASTAKPAKAPAAKKAATPAKKPAAKKAPAKKAAAPKNPTNK